MLTISELWAVTLAVTALSVIVLETFLLFFWRTRWSERGYSTSVFDRKTSTLTRRLLPLISVFITLPTYKSFFFSVSIAATFWLASIIFATDLTDRKIPKEPIWTIFFIILILLGFSGSVAGYFSFLTAFVAVTITMALTALLSKGKLGSSDVRLTIALTPLAGWLGFSPYLWGIIFSIIIQLVLKIIFRSKNLYDKNGYPFAPALLLGLFTAFLFLSSPGTPQQEWFIL